MKIKNLKDTGMTVYDLRKVSRAVKLGAKNGSGFVYCGDISAIDIPAVDKEITDGYKSTIKNAIDKIRVLTSKPRDYESFVRLCKTREEREIKDLKNAAQTRNREKENAEIKKIREEYEPTPEKHEAYLQKIDNDIETAKHTKALNERRLREFTSIGSRSLVESYPSIDERDTTIILYRGGENGCAWTTKEYRDLHSGTQWEPVTRRML